MNKNEFPIYVLSPLLKDAIKAICEVTATPVEVVAPIMLAEMAWSVQHHWNVRLLVKNGGTVPLSLFTLSIIESGGRKSTVFNLVSNGRTAFERESEERFEIAMSEFNVLLAEWEQRKRIIANERPNEHQTEEELRKMRVAHDRAKPKSPPNPKSHIVDATTAGLINKLKVCRPSVGIFTPEAGQVFNGYSANAANGGDIDWAAKICSLWDGASIVKDLSSENAALHNRRLSMGLLCQPETARTFLTSRTFKGQGIHARFLINSVPRYETPCVDLSDENSDGVDSRIAAFNTLLKGHHVHTPEYVEGSSQYELAPAILPWANRSNTNPLVQHYNAHWKDRQIDEDAGNTSFCARLMEHACRIAGVLAAFERCPAITDEHALAAVAIVEFYLTERERLDPGIAPSRLTELRDSVQYLRGWFSDNAAKGKCEIAHTYLMKNARRTVFSELDAEKKASVISSLVYEGMIEVVELASNNNKTAKFYRYIQ